MIEEPIIQKIMTDGVLNKETMTVETMTVGTTIDETPIDETTIDETMIGETMIEDTMIIMIRGHTTEVGVDTGSYVEDFFLVLINTDLIDNVTNFGN